MRFSADIPQVSEMVDLFLEAGGTYFDTAFAYPGSEEAIREALVKRYPRDRYTLASKLIIQPGSSISEEEAKQLTNDAYNSVNSVLPVKTYFTATESMKMYDLTINVFNKIGNDDGTMVYYLLTKNSKMSEPGVQLVSKPLDEELAKQLRGETEAESSEVSVNESDLAPEDGGSEE